MIVVVVAMQLCAKALGATMCATKATNQQHFSSCGQRKLSNPAALTFSSTYRHVRTPGHHKHVNTLVHTDIFIEQQPL